MNLENKKQIVIILLAVGLGLTAALLIGNHVDKSVKDQTLKISAQYSQALDPMSQRIDSLQAEIKRLEEEQKNAAVILQQAGAAGMAGATAAGDEEEAKERERKKREARSSLALRTPPGKRAYTVRIDSLSAVGGMVNPGDYVDVLAHMSMPDPVSGRKEAVHSMVFQNVLILAVGTDLKAAPNSYQKQQKSRSLALTFAMTPEEASLMSFIEKNGKMQLVLRAPDETETEVLDAASWRALADYMYEKQGTELVIPRTTAFVEPVKIQSSGDEVKPFIQIFQGGTKQ